MSRSTRWSIFREYKVEEKDTGGAYPNTPDRKVTINRAQSQCLLDGRIRVELGNQCEVGDICHTI